MSSKVVVEISMPIEQIQRKIGQAMVEASNLADDRGDGIYSVLSDVLDILMSAQPVPPTSALQGAQAD